MTRELAPDSRPPSRATGQSDRPGQRLVRNGVLSKAALPVVALAAFATQPHTNSLSAEAEQRGNVLGEAHAEPLVAPATVAQSPARAPELRWFRGNLHAHSLRSDGTDPPEIVLEWYRSHGYDFATLTEHNTISEEERWLPTLQLTTVGQETVRYHLATPNRNKFRTRYGAGGLELRLPPLSALREVFDEPDKFLVLPGEEITGAHGAHPVHVNAINIQQTVKPQTGPTVADTLNSTLDAVSVQEGIQGAPALKIINHPNYKWTFTPSHLAQARAAGYLDIMNGNPNTHSGGSSLHPAAEYAWDTANAIRLTRYGFPPLQGVAVDDMHRTLIGGANPGRAWVMVQASALTAPALIAALESQKFYASTGVSLTSFAYAADDASLEVEVAEGAGCRYSIDFVGVEATADLDSRLRQVEHSPALAARVVSRVFQHVEGGFARYHASGRELFVRAVVSSSRPHPNPAFTGQMQQAWTPVFGWKIAPPVVAVQ